MERVSVLSMTAKAIQSAIIAVASVSLVACNSATDTSASDRTEQQASAPAVASDSSPAAIYTVEPGSVTESYLTRDIRDDIFYFVMPDRFNNGSADNDNGSKTHAVSAGGFDRSNKAAYHGGDLIGLQQKLPYLKDMGITAIWMTPILRNQAIQDGISAYHGYWTIDFTEVDPHLGSNDDLHALIEAAHKLDIKIFFDIITNHSADVIKYRECHQENGAYHEGVTDCPYKSLEQVAKGDDYTPFVEEKLANIKTPAWLNDPKYYHNQGETTYRGEDSVYGDFAGLDDIDTDNPEVVTKLIKVFEDLITEFKPDGFRIDTVKHVNIDFWKEFVPEVMQHAQAEGIPRFQIFGEVYGADPVVLSRYTTVGELPSVLDFGFQGAIYDVYAKGQGTQKLADMFGNDYHYNDHDSNALDLMTFTGNHDMGRMGYFLRKEMPQINDEELVQRMIQSHALMYFSRGVPVIYYGDEQGFGADGNDHWAREDMMPSLVPEFNDNILIGTEKTTADDNFDNTHVIYQGFQDLAAIYKAHPALRSGDHYPRYAQDSAGMFAFSRVEPGEDVEYLVVFNSSTESQSITLDTTSDAYLAIVAASEFNINKGKASVSVAPLSYAVYRASTPLGTTENLVFSVTSNAVEGDKVWDKIVLEQAFEQSDSPVERRRIKVSMSVNDGEFVPVAIQKTPPYKTNIDIRTLVFGDKVRVKIVADNYAKETIEKQVEFVVNKAAVRPLAENEVYY